MAESRSKRGKKPDVPTIVRRAPGDRKRLTPELEEFARSDDKRIAPPPRRPRLHDPRPAALIPGVANRDARLVCDAQIARAVELLAQETPDEADALLAVFCLTRLWRGRSLTSFDVVALEFLDLPADEARARAERGAAAMGVALEPVSEESAAIWVRALAALTDARLTAGVRSSADGQSLIFEVPVDHAPEALLEMGRRMNSLVEDRKARERAEAKDAAARAAREAREEDGADRPRRGDGNHRR